MTGGGSATFSAEAGSDVGEGAVGLAFEHVLVAEARLQGAEVGDVGAHLDVVELLLVDGMGYVLPPAVPSHLIAGIASVDVCRQVGHLVGCGVATHKADTGDAIAMFGHQAVDGSGIEHLTSVRPQIRAVASRTPAGAARDVDGQGGLVGDLLEDDVGIEILQHKWISIYQELENCRICKLHILNLIRIRDFNCMQLRGLL